MVIWCVCVCVCVCACMRACVTDHPTSPSPGKLNVGDQILVCDGVSMLDITHDEAAQAFKRAMDMESVSNLKPTVA